MHKSLWLFGFLVLCSALGYAQSLEVMPGTERVFADVQWLQFLNEQNTWSLFSRTRATVDYEERTDLFSGSYLNYTTQSGLGGTVLGSISSRGADGDAGLHFFRAHSNFLVYALASVALDSELGYSWFSIARYTPSISENWRLYTSLELFSAFAEDGHAGSVQRMRAGLDRDGYQVGLALNLSGRGLNYEMTDTNPGIFVRKQF